MNRAFIDSVREHAEQGTAVLMSSHSLADVEQLCNSVTIIKAGRTVRSGSLADLRHLRRSRVTVTVPDASAAGLEHLDGIHDLTVERVGTADDITFTVEADHLNALTRALAAASPTALSIEPPSLEELFLHTYSDAS